MPRLVQKFGGSSVKDAKHILHVAKIVADAALEGKEIIVVVSAMGDTTDKFISLSEQISENPDQRELDMLLASGEQISIALLTMALHKLGLKARSFTGPQAGILTDDTHGYARIKTVHTSRLEASLRRGEIAVVAGFQGMTRASEVTTLGRGGSDTTAVALAAALKADCCDIYTDVDGVYTTDPRSCDTARKLHAISYEEMLALASAGAQVLNARSVELAMKNQVPIRLRSTFNPADTGTLVTTREFTPTYKVCGLACDNNRASFKLSIGEDFSTLNDSELDKEKTAVLSVAIQKFLDTLSSLDIATYKLNIHESSKRISSIEFTCEKRLAKDLQVILRNFVLELPGSEFSQDNQIALLSLVGSNISLNNNVCQEIQSVLSDACIPVKFVTTNEISISAVIPEECQNAAVKELHQKFCLQISSPPADLVFQ